MSHKKPKVLYVDDEKANLTAFKHEFKEFYEIYLAESGKDGLEILEENKDIGVIISDQRMPKMTGVVFLEKSVINYPDSVRMILTGYSDIESVVEAINKGGVHKYITKPWDHDELRISIDNSVENFNLKKRNKELIVDLQKANLSLEKKVQGRTAELEEKNQKLEELNNEKDGMINVVAHDLQSPFSKILGLVNIMALAGDFNVKQQEYATLINKVGEQGAALIQDLLDIHAFENEREEHNLEEISVHSFIKGWIRGYDKEIERKEQHIILHFQKEEIIWLANKSLLCRVLDNLITNAMKFSEKGTTIGFSIQSNTESISFSIKDQGPGISEEDQKLMFRKFQKLSALPTGGEGSNGLGLSIIKTLVKRMTGTITVNSELGQGTEFIVSFAKGK